MPQDITSLFTQALTWPYFKRAAMEAKQRRHEDKRIDGIHNIVQCTLTYQICNFTMCVTRGHGHYYFDFFSV